MSLKSRLKSFIASPDSQPANGFLFPTTIPEADGEACLHDCDTCTIHLPRTFKIDEVDKLYGEINGWSRHIIVGTGKTDWVRDVADEKGSVMEAVGRWKEEHEKGGKGSNEKLMLSASNIPLPEQAETETSTDESVREQRVHGATCVLLPSFTTLEGVTPGAVPQLLGSGYFQNMPTNTSVLSPSAAPAAADLPAGIQAKTCPHDYLILLCSQKTRDARCGQSAPLLKREFERHLRPLGLYRDLDDDRPGGVGIYFISHVGGHKYSANVMVYRSTKAAQPSADNEKTTNGEEVVSVGDTKEAAQCIWLARVRPEDCENIVRYTVLKGKVVKPARQLRGGFDRATGKVSW